MRRGENVLIFSGSTDEQCPNRTLARSVAAVTAELRIEATLLDLREYPLPLYERGIELNTGIPRNAMALRAQLKRHAAWLVVSPDHHNTTSTLLRNVIDWAACRAVGDPPGACFKNKTVGLLSAVDAADVPSRGVAHLRDILVHLGASVVDGEFLLAGSAEAFDPDGTLRDASRRADLRAFVEATRSSLLANVTPAAAASLAGTFKSMVSRLSLASPG